ncbi:MAG TPA: hypothetical protein VL091_04720 [Marinobacter sp.]|nr:hypothetical protein [Marinobacter sp.]
MQYSDGWAEAPSGAVFPVAWYLLNLLVIPGMAFLVLVGLFVFDSGASDLRRAHTRAALFMSVLGAVLMISGIATGWLFWGNTGNFWTFALIWATVLHTSFVLWGIVSLARAMSDKRPYFPVRWL